MTGLVLTAGGARGAYQAGVLRRIGELPRLKKQPSPFPIVTGASAGIDDHRDQLADAAQAERAGGELVRSGHDVEPAVLTHHRRAGVVLRLGAEDRRDDRDRRR